MKASELRKLKGRQVEALEIGGWCRRRTCTVLDVKGRNVLVDTGGATDWLWIPDHVFKPITTTTEAP